MLNRNTSIKPQAHARCASALLATAAALAAMAAGLVFVCCALSGAMRMALACASVYLSTQCVGCRTSVRPLPAPAHCRAATLRRPGRDGALLPLVRCCAALSLYHCIAIAIADRRYLCAMCMCASLCAMCYVYAWSIDLAPLSRVFRGPSLSSCLELERTKKAPEHEHAFEVDAI
eukprot:scaffold8783_cov135-Isochrysis_galbana.AAC.2